MGPGTLAFGRFASASLLLWSLTPPAARRGPGPHTLGGVTGEGEADPRLAAALAAGTPTPAARAELLAALADARVFAAVTATATGVERTAAGRVVESSSEMAVVLLQAPDGLRALPVFSDVASMRRWRLDLRPVSLTGVQACAAAQDEGATTLLLDPAGAALALNADEVAALASGWVPVAGSRLAARRTTDDLAAPRTAVAPELGRALRQAIKGEPLQGARLLAGPDGPVLGVVPRAAMDAAELTALAGRVAHRLGPALPSAGLDLAVVPPDGPGERVLAGRGWRRFRRRR